MCVEPYAVLVLIIVSWTLACCTVIHLRVVFIIHALPVAVPLCTNMHIAQQMGGE